MKEVVNGIAVLDHGYVRLVDMMRLGDEMTYDIEVDGEHHNYVANGLVVHNSYNEASARYAPLPDLNYLPTIERLMAQAGSNKQAGGIAGALAMTPEAAEKFRVYLIALYRHAQVVYEAGLADGVPKELARLVLPVGRYSRMRCSANLRNWLAFLTLRQAPEAQFEIRQYANVVAGVLTEAFPRTMSLFNEKR